MRIGRFTFIAAYWITCGLGMYGTRLLLHHQTETTHDAYVTLLAHSLAASFPNFTPGTAPARSDEFWQVTHLEAHEVDLDAGAQEALREQGRLTRIEWSFFLPRIQSILYLSDQNSYLGITRAPSERNKLTMVFYGWILGAWFLFTLLSLLEKSFMKVLKQLIDAAERMCKGDFTVRARETGPDPLMRLGNSLNRLSDEMVRMQEEQKVITHALNHEIRTPLARLRLAMDMMQSPGSGKTSAALLQKMDRDIDEMEMLAKEMLQWARLTHRQEQVNMGPIALGRMVHELIGDLSELNPHVSIIPTVPSAFFCTGNLPLLRQALINTIRNAQKYANTEIHIGLETNETTVSLIIDDDGPGIPKKDRERIFIPFKCLDESRSRQTGGVGLGMAIVHQIMIAHGGFARADRSPLGGARIHLSWEKGPLA